MKIGSGIESGTCNDNKKIEIHFYSYSSAVNDFPAGYIVRQNMSCAFSGFTRIGGMTERHLVQGGY